MWWLIGYLGLGFALQEIVYRTMIDLDAIWHIPLWLPLFLYQMTAIPVIRGIITTVIVGLVLYAALALGLAFERAPKATTNSSH